MKLEHGLELLNIDYNDMDAGEPEIFNTTDYMFTYKNYKIELSVNFSTTAYTTRYFMPVLNFGYSTNLYRWYKKDAFYGSMHREYEDNDGRSIAKFIDSRPARQLLTKFVHKYVKKYISKNKPPIIIRGPLSEFKQNSPRYQKIDEMLIDAGYKRIIAKCNDVPYISTKRHMEDEDKERFYLYALDDFAYEELTNHFLGFSDKTLAHKHKKKSDWLQVA